MKLRPGTASESGDDKGSLDSHTEKTVRKPKSTQNSVTMPAIAIATTSAGRPQRPKIGGGRSPRNNQETATPAYVFCRRCNARFSNQHKLNLHKAHSIGTIFARDKIRQVLGSGYGQCIMCNCHCVDYSRTFEALRSEAGSKVSECDIVYALDVALTTFSCPYCGIDYVDRARAKEMFLSELGILKVA